MTGRDEVSWMWPEACAMVARAERLHRQFFHVGRSARSEPVWEPPVDVLEAPRHIVVIVGLPGVPPQSIDVTIDRGELLVAGQRAYPPELDTAWVHRLELPQGRFERRIPLPRGRYHDVRTSSAHGCLYITLTKLI